MNTGTLHQVVRGVIWVIAGPTIFLVIFAFGFSGSSLVLDALGVPHAEMVSVLIGGVLAGAVNYFTNLSTDGEEFVRKG